MRDELGVLYTDDRFVDPFAVRGQPAESPGRLVLVTVMQFAEGLSDRQAADAVRARIAWKYALGLELTDPGFNFSILSEFRQRLIAGQREQLLLGAMLDALKQCHLLKARGRQWTDSTQVLAAIRELNRREIVGETLRRALNELADTAPEWLQTIASPDWFWRYAQRFDTLRLPQEPAARQQLIETMDGDGVVLLRAIQASSARETLCRLPGVEILRQMWVQQYYCESGEEGTASICLRTNDEQPSGEQRLHSLYDVEARYSAKRTTEWVGYKVFLTDSRQSPVALALLKPTVPVPNVGTERWSYTLSLNMRPCNGRAALKKRYAQRSGIEVTISPGTRAFDLRASRYVGLIKTHLQMIATATAINLHRLFGWWTEVPPALTRVSSFARLAPDPALIPSSWRASRIRQQYQDLAYPLPRPIHTRKWLLRRSGKDLLDKENKMTEVSQDYESALELFKLQLKCVVNDDRKTQMEIYAEDLRYEFPFANDRPKLIEGRDAFKKAMEPIWERRRKNNIKLALDKYEFHATDEVGLFLAIFVLKAFFDDKPEPVSSPCVQLLRIHDGSIVEVREYFEP